MTQHDHQRGVDPETPSAKLISPAEAMARFTKGALLVDVRRLERRVENGTIAGAILIDRAAVSASFGSDARSGAAGEQGLDREIIVFCSSENGSLPVVEKLSELGYRNLSHIAGGFRAWKADGLPTDVSSDSS